MAEIPIAEKEEEWRAVGTQIAGGFIDAWIKSDTSKFVVTLLSDVVGAVLGASYIAMAPIGTGFAKSLSNAEDVIAPAFAEFAAQGVNDIFGTQLSAAEFARGPGRGKSDAAGNALGALIMGQLAGPTGGIAPSQGPAEKFIAAQAGTAIEDWFKGWFFEVLSSLIPMLDIGKIENYGALGDKVARSVGVDRVARRVTSALADVTIVTPLEWQTHKAYRPRLLSAAETARQVARGRLTREQGIEELARQGYSDARIEALFNAAAKFHSVGDVDLLWRSGQWSREQAVQHLRDQGYESTVAETELDLERLRQIATFERRMADAAVAAYVDGRITDPELNQWVAGATIDGKEQAQLVELAHARRALAVKQLSPAEARACVKAGILSVRDYRVALERDGYSDEAVVALELLLRHELDERARIEDIKQQQAEERAAEEQRRAEERARKAAAAEAELMLQRRGRAGDLRRAVVRGLIPVSRLVEVLSAQYDPDTVEILVEAVELDRLAHLEQQRKREEAVKRAERRALSLGDLERAVLANALPIVDYRRRIELAGLSSEDADLLTRTLVARLADLEEARRRRDEAEIAARNRAIDLGRFEQLVRRGVRSMAQYDALLRELGFGDGARAGMIELLQIQIAEDAEARRQREEAEARLRVKGLSLEQFRRGVILGVKTQADFERFLLEEGFTADAQVVLVAELQQAVEDAEAARRRREAADARQDAPAISLSRVARAARLGVVSPDVYRARLEREQFTEEDIAIEMELLLLEIADTQAARQRAADAEAAAAQRGLSLSAVARAVRLGVRTLEDYRAAAVGSGLPLEDVELLVQTLGAEIRQIEEARTRRSEIDAELRPRNLSVAQLEEAVEKDFRSIEDFMADVMALGYSAEDAQLLAALLLHDLEAKGGA